VGGPRPAELPSLARAEHREVRGAQLVLVATAHLRLDLVRREVEREGGVSPSARAVDRQRHGNVPVRVVAKLEDSVDLIAVRAQRDVLDGAERFAHLGFYGMNPGIIRSASVARLSPADRRPSA